MPPKVPPPLVIPARPQQHISLPWLSGERPPARDDEDERWQEVFHPSSRWDSYSDDGAGILRSCNSESFQLGNDRSPIPHSDRSPIPPSPRGPHFFNAQTRHNLHKVPSVDTLAALDDATRFLRFQKDAEVVRAAAGCMAVEARIAARGRRDEEKAMALQAGHIKTISLLMLTLLGIGFVLVHLKSVMVPLVLALLLAVILEPLLRWLVRAPCLMCHCQNRTRQIRIVLAVAACLLLMLFCILASGYMVFTSVIHFPVEKYTNSVRLERLADYLDSLSSDLGAENSEEVESVESAAKDTEEKLLDWIVGGPLLTFLGTTLSVMSTLFLMFLFLMFLLVDKASRADADVANEIKNNNTFSVKVQRSIKRYVLVKSMASLAICVLTGIILTLLRVDLAMLFAFLAFILNFIPHVGYTFSVAGPVILVYLDPTKSWTDVVLCVVFLTLIHQIVINVVEPRILARHLDLHPMVVILTLAFWTVCWGAVGTLLSTPLTCIFRLVLLELNHPYAVRLANMLEGRPFQQRPAKASLGPIRPSRIAEADRATVAWVSAMAPPVGRSLHSRKYLRSGAERWMQARRKEESDQQQVAEKSSLLSEDSDSASYHRKPQMRHLRIDPPSTGTTPQPSPQELADKKRVKIAGDGTGTGSDSLRDSVAVPQPHVLGNPRLTLPVPQR